MGVHMRTSDRWIERALSRSRKFGRDDKWNFCLITAIVAVNRRNHEQTTPPEPLTGLQDPMGRWIATGALTE
jgi:hypothetical protein